MSERVAYRAGGGRRTRNSGATGQLRLADLRQESAASPTRRISHQQVTKVVADSVESLAEKLEGVDPPSALKEIARYNAAVRTDISFNPNVKDGRRTEGLSVNKTNWANTIDLPPFHAYQVGCEITFTFGGLRINELGQVLNVDLSQFQVCTLLASLSEGCFISTIQAGLD